MSVYTDEGYKNRKDYLKNLADDYGVPVDVVFTLAQLLGPDEDFDGLISGLEDYADEMAILEDAPIDEE